MTGVQKKAQFVVCPKKNPCNSAAQFLTYVSERSSCWKSNLALVLSVCLNINCPFKKLILFMCATGLCFLELTLIFVCKMFAQNIHAKKDIRVIAKLFLSTCQFLSLNLQVCKYAKIYF
jgi:hypothetical protein